MPIDRWPARPKLSAKAWAAVLASSVLPVLAVAAYIGAPMMDGLNAIFFGGAAELGLLLGSVVEFVIGLCMRSRLLCLDGGLRALLVLALASPIGWAVLAFEPIAWSFVQSLNPAYACRTSTCEDAIVDSLTVGGGMCYVELVRLSDPRGGRAAAIRVLQRSWPSFSLLDDDEYAAQSSLISLGRGFYRAVRCADWD